jgi:DNA-binding transcriptional MerR regulator
MNWTIPGTVIVRPREEAELIQQQFSSIFLVGGIALGQISELTGLEPYTIQNWVKRGFLSPPDKKRYSLHQLCRILTINTLKNVLPMERICSLLEYINGQLDDEADDIIDDSTLYFMFVRLAAKAKTLYNAADRDTLMEQELADYQEPVPLAKERVKKVLRIMLTAWLAARMYQEAERMLKELE